MNKILLIEDNAQLQKYICDYLSVYDFTVHVLTDYDAVLETISQLSPSLILLDINLPQFDGFYYLKLIRKQYSIPIIIISARSEDSEQIRGMTNGADDYVTKPFSIGVLLAKINAVLRRTEQGTTLSAGALTLSESDMSVRSQQKSAELTKNEYKILRLLFKKPGQIVSRETILEELWDSTNFVDDNTLTVNISRVKKKLAELGFENAIMTKRSVGYALDLSNC